MKQEAYGMHLKGKTWIPFITRNVSFWHNWIDNEANLFLPQFANEDTFIDEIRYIENGSETTIFNLRSQADAYASNLLKCYNSSAKVKILKSKFISFGNDLLASLYKLQKKISSENLREFTKLYQNYAPSLHITASLGRHGYDLIKEEISKLGISQEKIDETIGIITYPDEHTPLFNSTTGIIEIGADIQAGKSEKIIEQSKKTWLKLYSHIPANFCEDSWMMKDLNEMIKSALLSNCKAKLASELKNHERKLKKKSEVLKQLNSKKLNFLSYLVAEATYLNEYRKGIFEKVSLGFRPVQEKAAKICKSKNWKDAYYFTPQELISVFGGKKINLQKLTKQRKIVAILSRRNKSKKGFETVILNKKDTTKVGKFVLELHGKKSSNKKEKTEQKQENSDSGITLKGISANQGKVTGHVKVILGKRDFNKFNKNDILVAPMTSVDYVPIMEKAAAFVTNEGGITSHASIVSREMNKPCIIGTKTATSILKDGDIVEVDANKGIITLIKRSL